MHRITKLFFMIMLTLVIACQLGPSGKQWSVKSPDGAIKVTIASSSIDSAYTQLAYQVTLKRKVVLPWSPLGIERDDQSFVHGLRFIEKAHAQISEQYTMLHGKQKRCSANGHELSLTFNNANDAPVNVIFRAYNNGIAFRYQFPNDDKTVRTIKREWTGFQVPHKAVAFMQPYDEATMWTPAYEAYFEKDIPAGTTSPIAAGWCFPALFEVNAGQQWLLISEALIDGSYCGTRLNAEAPGGLYSVRFPDSTEGNNAGDVEPTHSLPWATPWRVIMVGTSLKPIVESMLIEDLSLPSTLDNTDWIKPGRVSWSWWSESDSPRDPARLKAFIDLAAEMGWDYSLVDANWNFMPDNKLESVIEYAKQKGVGLLFWYNSGGPHNKVTEAPRDRMMPQRIRRQEFEWLQKIGVKGVKVDFFQSDKQNIMQHYINILEDAADYKIMVNFHGCTLPRGWARTYPNLITMEGVKGAENYKFNEQYPEKAPWHNTVLAFTRNVVGSMDYTPVTFSDSQFPHRTTNAHELALSVVFESGWLHFADGVDSYRRQPDFVKAFLKVVPTVWDETKFISGYPGKDVLLARRNGDMWYIGCINGEKIDKVIRLPLSFLSSGSYEMNLIGDGESDRMYRNEKISVKAGETIEISVRSNGGFVAEIVSAK